MAITKVLEGKGLFGQAVVETVVRSDDGLVELKTGMDTKLILKVGDVELVLRGSEAKKFADGLKDVGIL